jgi:uncharacterized SAM-binding protein YcdF (DUF218 family)
VRARAVLTAAVGGAIAFAALGYGECVARVSGFRARDLASARADVAVVLGAAVWGHGRPSPVFERRLRAALALFQRGSVGWIATTGGVGRGARGPSLAEGEAGARWLARHGVARDRLLVEDRSRNTLENVRYLAPALRARGLSRALVVSDGYHLARGVTLARDAGLRAEGVACDGDVATSLAREPARRWSEARWLWLYALTRPTARW